MKIYGQIRKGTGNLRFSIRVTWGNGPIAPTEERDRACVRVVRPAVAAVSGRDRLRVLCVHIAHAFLGA